MLTILVVFGLFGGGKPPLVMECGACGRAARRGATRCEHCGVEFEPEVAKCSHCASWIPAGAATCPKCNVEFHTFRTEWSMRGADRPIMLPRPPEPKEMGDVPASGQVRPGASRPRIVEEPDQAQLQGVLDEAQQRNREMRAARGSPDEACPNCGGFRAKKEGTQNVCLVCGTHW